MLIYKIRGLKNFEKLHKDYFELLLNALSENELLSSKISEIVITDDIEGEIKRHSSERFREPKLTISREYRAVAKTVDFDGKKKVFLDANYVNYTNKYAPQIFFEQLIELYAEGLISSKYTVPETFEPNTPLTDVTKIFFYQWATKIVANDTEKKVSFEQEKIHVDVKMYVDTFKRNIRKIHYKHQEDLSIDKFWIDVLMELDSFIRRCLDVKCDDGKFDKLQEFEKIIPLLLMEIELQTDNLIKNKELEISQIKNYLLEILKICFIEIPSENPMNVKIIESPKKLFKGNLTDTEPRIVAFMDILGFSAIIEEYDSDEASNILNELHDALNLAVENALENIQNSKALTELKEFLEYRMFSDCICISLPYIEYGNDFHIQFNSLSTVVKSYQFIMMQKGFFVRGGISVGSYFSDKNMIFSGGLVSAYHLDKGTPVVAVHKNVIERLRYNYKKNSKDLIFNGSLIYASQEPEKIFVNPFELLDNSAKHFSYIQYSIDDMIKESENGSSDPLDEITNSIMKMTKTITDPIFRYAKSQMTSENLNIGKEEILKQVNKQIDKHNELLSKPNLTNREREELEKIISKYEFLQQLCNWSLKKGEDGNFLSYHFD